MLHVLGGRAALCPGLCVPSRGCAQQQQEESGGERRAGAIPRNPTVTTKAMPSSAARTGMPIRLKDSSAVEALSLVLGPATQQCGPASPGPALAAPVPPLPWELPVPFSRSEAESWKAEGKTSYRAETPAKKLLAGGKGL